ncbi:hypothetical protein H2198_004289 [Neophaeococcomyces mojaviensis]|uniref:Uncharacterized protein n=1 Tax=Neophaeococcomyces mojaviensis TaxID=3383035 RepID=A0ACC3A928_9EURO|nr:hypothetical protein H2198_004289 [Knufia sp. JES_112]
MADSNHRKHDLPRLAISNSKRRVLPGPQFLDHVIPFGSSDNIAIDHLDAEHRSDKLSYRCLNQLSELLGSQIWQWLSKKQHHHTIVPVVIPQQPALYVSYLALLKIGAAFCPITPDTPDERLCFIVEDVGASLVLCLPEAREHLQDILPLATIVTVDIHLLGNVQKSWTDRPSDPQATVSNRKPSDIAYVMYTSGSTGKPKGVPVSHHAVTQSLLAHEEHIPSFKRFLQFAAPTFDVSVFEIFFPWFRGSTVVSCHREHMLADLPGVVNSRNIDAVELTPTVATALLRRRSAAPKLKVMLTIGEMLTPHVVQEFGGSVTQDSILFAMYGPTEAAIHCTILPRMAASSPIRVIGQPLSTVTAFILREENGCRIPEILQVNETGELAIAGQLAEGYLKRPDQTTAAFIQLPGYGAVYRTGDRAIMTANGEIHILGRISGGQVKLRGQRVELGEIEEAACQAPGVDLALAMVVDQMLVLFCSGDAALKNKDVEEKCKAWLPQHMRPGHIIIVKTGMPRLPSGKVDRKSLESMYTSSYADQGAAVPPPNSRTESILLSAFTAALHTPVDCKMSLWTCGLDSLRAICIASGLRNDFPAISVPLILEADTIGDLAGKLDALNFQASFPLSTEIFENTIKWRTMKRKLMEAKHDMLNEMDVDGIYPCSAMQIAMLSETMKDPTLNVNEIVLNFGPSISSASVIDALEEISRKNGILSSGFMITNEAEMPFVQVNKRHLSLDGSFSILEPLKATYNNRNHSLVIRIHHAIYDGWSWDLIMLDMNTMLKGGTLPNRPSYREFDQKKQEQMAVHDGSDLTAWVDYLHEAEITTFPLMTSTICHTTARRQAVTELTASLTDISDAARSIGASPAALLHAALVLLLSTYIDSKTVVTGLVTAGREALLPFVEDVIGPCLSTMPAVVHLDRLQSVQDLVKHVYQQHLHCLRHPNVTLAQVQSALNQPDHNKLFDVLFAWQQSLASAGDVEPLVWTTETQDSLEYPLIVEVEPAKETLRLKTTFDECRLSQSQIELFHDQLDSITCFLIRQLNDNLVDLWPWLPHSALSVSNTNFVCSELGSLTSTIAKQAHEHPEKVAIDFVQEFNPLKKSLIRKTLSYEQLYRQSQRLAGRLQDRHIVGRNVIVAIRASKSIELYVTIYAIVTAGSAYLCIDPNVPESRMKEILLEAKCSTLISDMPLNEDTFGQVVVSMTDLFANLALPDENTEFHSQAQDLAYAVFTSGSTGVPKGVLITRENLLSNIDHLARIYPHARSSRLLQSCSPAFDVSVFEIFWTWHCGMTLCSASNDVLFRDLEVFIDVLDITHLSMTPSVAALVNPHKVPKVQFLVCAGEPMSAKVFEAWADHGLHQGYGPSETTNICNVRNYALGKAPINNIGPVFSNTSLFICSRLPDERRSQPLKISDFQLIPRGGCGEIWIGGAQVGRGYTDAVLSAQSWLDHPKFGRLYRSGDIGRLLADDSVVILGREDDQMKIRGQRIELNEISSKLMQSHRVSDAVALILKDAADRDKLVAFWVHNGVNHGDAQGIIDVLFDHLRDTLPSYMIPELLIPIPSVPVTRQGKVDKRKLTAVHDGLTKDEHFQLSSTVSSDDEHMAVTEEEAQAIKLVSLVSGVPAASINPHASFFSYGIDSIRAITLAKRLRDAGIGEVDVSKILRYSSVRRLLSHIRKQREASGYQRSKIGVSETVPEELRKMVTTQFQDKGFQVEHVAPCTPLQEAMLSSPNTSHQKSYLNHIVYHVSVDIKTMKDAWATMVSRHQILRTAFTLTDRSDYPFVQVVFSTINFPWLEPETPSANLVPAQLAEPMYQLQFVLRESHTSELHLFMHHALYDAEALNQLQYEIQAFCHRTRLPEAVPFTRYLEFMVNADSLSCKGFWHTVLDKTTPCRLKQLLGANKVCKNKMSTATHSFPIPLSQLKSRIKQFSSTLLAVLQTSMARLLLCYLKTSDICFGTVFSGRNISDSSVSNIVGPCFNTLPTRARIQHNTTNVSLAQSFQKFNADVLPFQSTSLRQLQRDYSPDGQLLFDMLLLLQSSPTDLDDKVWQLVREEGQMDFPFILEVIPNPREGRVDLQMHSNFCSDVQFLETFLGHFSIFLEHTTMHPFASALDVSQVGIPMFKIQTNGHAALPIRSSTYHEGTKQSDGFATALQIVIDSMKRLTKRDLQNASHNHSIFQLGLDSISVVQMASDLRSKGITISAADILENPRLANIAELCTYNPGSSAYQAPQKFDLNFFEAQHRQDIIGRLGCDSRAIESIWPCTSTQIGILSEYLRTDGLLYYNTMQLRLNPDTNLSRLKEAFRLAMSKHVMLRTGFVDIKDAECPYAMLVYSPASARLPWRGIGKERNKSIIEASVEENLAHHPWRIDVERKESVIFLNFHILHSLYDARSLQIILSDVVAAYHGKGLPNPSPVSRALSTILVQNRKSIEAEGFFGKLKTKVQPTKFPNLNITREVPYKLSVSTAKTRHTASEIQTFCEALDINLWTVCQVAWARLLAAYCGQQDIVFGTILSGRDLGDDELNRVAFPCLNILPIVVSVAQPDNELIATVKRSSSELLRNQHVPLSKIKAIWEVEGTLFDSLLVLQKYDRYRSYDALWSVESEEASAEYVVSLEIVPSHQTLILQLTYNEKCLPVGHSALLLQQFEYLLYQVLRVDIGDAERVQPMIAALPPKNPVIPTKFDTLHEMVLDSAARHPQQFALEFVTNIENDTISKRTWTYMDLRARASSIVHLLIENNAKPGDLVAVCFDKCPEASFALLGILMAGCAYVAIDPGAPTSRKQFILKDARCKIVLTTALTTGLFEDIHEAKVHVLDDAKLSETASMLIPQPVRFVSGDDTCYCLYTSGTTGEPKGCLISHKSAVQAMFSFSRIFDGHWTRDSRWLQFASYHFDVSVLEHFWSWKEGICLTMAPRDLLFEDLPGTINKLEITHLDLTPSLARLLTPETVPSLCNGVFIVGGEEVQQDIIDTWGGAGCLYNFYGPSEVTIGCTAHPRVQKNVKPTNIGQQWDNAGSYVLQPHSEEPVLVGAVGELCLSGVLVGKGYLNRPELTAEKFVTLKTDGERIYRTGDLVRMLHDHSFEFLGRIDDQVKLRGQRLEIGEINHVLLQGVAEVKDVATLVLTHPEQQKEHLVSFLAQTKSPRSKSLEHIISTDTTFSSVTARTRKYAATHLPGYMVPVYIVFVNSLPLTVNNKVDAKALRCLYSSTPMNVIREWQSLHGSTSQIPDVKLNEFIQVIASFLDIEPQRIERTTSLFQLGVDSVAVIGLSRFLKQAGYTNASVATIMKKSVVADLAEALILQDVTTTSTQELDFQQSMDRINNFAARHRESIEKAWRGNNMTVKHIAPCTPLQEGMVSKLVSNPDETPPYLTKFIYYLEDNIDVSQLQVAWDKLQGHLDILRTYLMATNDGYAQVILEQSSDAVHIDYGTTFIQEDSLDAINGCFERWSQQVSRLECVLPWQVWLTRRESENQWYMSLFIFHGIYDGNSIPLLLEALHGHYIGNVHHKNHTTQFHQALSRGPLLLKNDAPNFWHRRLPYLRLLNLPFQHGNKASVRTESMHGEFCLEKIGLVSSTLRTTHQAILHAAWLFTLAKHFEINPIIGVVLSGRSVDIEDVDQVIGPMFNTLPFMVSSVSKGASLADLIKVCHTETVEVLPFQHSSLSNIKKWIKVKSNRELFNSLFVYQDSRHLGNQASRWPWVERQSNSIPDYPLNIEIERVASDKFSVTIVMSIAVDNTDIIRRLMDTLVEILKQIENSSHLLLPNCFFDDSTGVNLDHHEENYDINMGKKQEVFTWTPEAQLIKTELASLAQISDNSISHDSPTIFELGLDSIDALKLASRLNAKGVKLPVSKILQYPYVQGMLEQWSSLEGVGSKNNSKMLHRQHTRFQSLLQQKDDCLNRMEVIAPTTPLQEGLLLDFEQYFHTFTYRLGQDVDVGRLIKAVNQTVHDLPILRTNFSSIEAPEEEVCFVQMVARAQRHGRQAQRSFQLADFAALERHVGGLKAHACIEDSAPQISVVTLKENDTYLIVSLSHASYDAWSLKVVHDHIQDHYYGNAPAEQSTMRLAEYVYDVRQAGRRQSTVDFWSKQLESVQPTLFPASNHTNHTAVLKTMTSAVSAQHASAMCKQSGITMQSLGLAAWALALMTITKQLDINFGLIMSGRTTEEAQNLAFPTFNTVIFRLPTNSNPHKQEFLRQIHQLTAQIYEHQHMPLAKALRLAGENGGDLFNTLFTFQKIPESTNEEEPLYEDADVGEGLVSPPYPVNVELEEKAEGLIWTVAVQACVMSSSEVQNVLQRLDHIFAFLIRQETTNVFEDVGQGQTTSVCGLQPTQLSRMPDQADRHPAVAPDRADTGDGHWSDLETKIRVVFSNVSDVNIADINHNTNLFNLGLDSISAIKVSNLLRKAGERIPVSMILRGQTIQKIAASSSTSEATSRTPPATQIVPHALKDSVHDLLRDAGVNPDNVEDVLPATAGQAYVLDMWQASNNRLFYPEFWFAISNCEKPNFNTAFGELVKRVPALRTRFLLDKAGYQQVVYKANSGDHAAFAWQYEVVPNGSGILLALRLHHAFYDAVSLELMVRKLQDLLEDRKTEMQLNTDFKSFIDVTSGDNPETRQFWTDYIGHAKQNSINAAGSFGASRLQLFESELLAVSGIEELARQESISVQAIFFAAVGRIVAAVNKDEKSLGESDSTVLGVWLANRSLDIDGLSELVAPTFNIVPLKVNIRTNLMLSARQVQEDLQEISKVENSGVSLENIYAWTGLRVDCFVNFLKLPGQDVTETGEGGEEKRGAVVRHAEGEAREYAQTLFKESQKEAASPIINARVGEEDWKRCLPSLDIEAKIDEQGRLAVGLFAPEDMKDEKGLQEMMDAIKRVLEEAKDE